MGEAGLRTHVEVKCGRSWICKDDDSRRDVRGTRGLIDGGDGDLCEECDCRRVRTATHLVGRSGRLCHEDAARTRLQLKVEQTSSPPTTNP